MFMDFGISASKDKILGRFPNVNLDLYTVGQKDVGQVRVFRWEHTWRIARDK